MTTTTSKTIIRTIGASVVANTTLKANEVFYEFEHPNVPESDNWITINPGTTEKVKLLSDLYKNTMIVNLLPFTRVNTNDPNKDPNLLSALMDLVEDELSTALAVDYTFGDIIRRSKILTILFEGKANPQAQIAFCHIFFEVVFFTEV